MTNINKMSNKELADKGVPYWANLEDLEALGIDPAPYFRDCMSCDQPWGYVLDRKKDAALIERLQSMEEEHTTKQ
jgi:hypothetical protein